MESIRIELNDLSSELTRSFEQLEANPARLEEVNASISIAQ